MPNGVCGSACALTAIFYFIYIRIVIMHLFYSGNNIVCNLNYTRTQI